MQPVERVLLTSPVRPCSHQTHHQEQVQQSQVTRPAQSDHQLLDQTALHAAVHHLRHSIDHVDTQLTQQAFRHQQQ